MNNYSKLSEIDESNKVGNVLHENMYSFSSMRLRCRLNTNIFENENFDVDFEVIGTSGNNTKRRKGETSFEENSRS